MDIRIDVAFRNIREREDPGKRSEHIFDRMLLRGIGKEQIKDAVKKGAKNIRKDGSIIAGYKWFKVVYREFRFKNMRKIYPITVMEV